jgi:hypothetical protein
MFKSLKLLLCSLLLMTTATNATTFIPVTIKKQIVESSGIIEGEVLAISSEESRDGRIYSRVFLKANKWLDTDVENNHIEVFYPGGKVGDHVYKIQGAPEFKVGEKVVLFTKKLEDKNYVMNLGLGKFSIKNLGRTQLIVNQIYPNRPEVGQMRLSNFYELAQEIKGKKFSERFKNKYELNIEKQTSLNRTSEGRSIASIASEKAKEKDRLPDYWLVIILGFCGVGYSLFRKRSNEI